MVVFQALRTLGKKTSCQLVFFSPVHFNDDPHTTQHFKKQFSTPRRLYQARALESRPRVASFQLSQSCEVFSGKIAKCSSKKHHCIYDYRLSDYAPKIREKFEAKWGKTKLNIYFVYYYKYLHMCISLHYHKSTSIYQFANAVANQFLLGFGFLVCEGPQLKLSREIYMCEVIGYRYITFSHS